MGCAVGKHSGLLFAVAVCIAVDVVHHAIFGWGPSLGDTFHFIFGLAAGWYFRGGWK
jgi:ribulose-5-phosphate 4-epimerase/fuculose-1-phosphate aldolase